ncbi:MAG TPA: HlyD family efflux transporter periplasmic adaptor subunit [Nannocystaceae bacterium]|nr:HlyD family efflux transporter periplasmic adaptor subunit [Nannocystaceae bacterium]
MSRIAIARFALLACACRPSGETGTFATVERGALVVTVDVAGTMRAVDSDRLGPPGVAGVWNYKIAMMAEEGKEVAEGDPVLMFDTSDLQRTLDEKIAERDSAAKQLEVKQSAARVAREDERLAVAEAQSELRKAKVKADAPPSLTAAIDVEKARIDLELARDKIDYLEDKSRAARARDEADISRWRSKRDRAEGRVAEMQAAIQQMTVLSPRSGTVIHHTDWEGKKKKVGDGAWRAETVLLVASLALMEADGEIDEVDISKVAVDQAVSLRLDAQADVEVRGSIRRISHSVQRVSPENPLRVAHLDITLAHDQDVRLRPGMRFRGAIETARLEDVLLVPLDTAIPTPDGPVVHRRRGATVEVVPVTLGARNASSIVIESGVEEGDRILHADEGTR